MAFLDTTVLFLFYVLLLRISEGLVRLDVRFTAGQSHRTAPVRLRSNLLRRCASSSETTAGTTTTDTGVRAPVADFTYVPAPSDDARQQLVQPLCLSDGEAILNERRAVFVRLRSMSPRRLQVWKVVSEAGEPVNMRTPDGLEGSCAGTIEPSGILHFSTAVGSHIFYTACDGDGAGDGEGDGDCRPAVGQFCVAAEEQTYVIHDDTSRHRPSADDVELWARERCFLDEYRQRSGGNHWRHHYGFMGPRGAPKLPSWPADVDGRVTSSARYWTDETHRAQGDVQLRVRSVCAAPRIYLIEDFLAPFEVDAIVAQAAPTLARSLVGTVSDGGSRESHVRTSRNTWLRRNSSEVVATLYERAADALGISRSVFLPQANAVEDLQVVHYAAGEAYRAHHDWAVSNAEPYSRFATLLIYLSDMPSPAAGGETAFPKAEYEGDRGLKIVPRKGAAWPVSPTFQPPVSPCLALSPVSPSPRSPPGLSLPRSLPVLSLALSPVSRCLTLPPASSSLSHRPLPHSPPGLPLSSSRAKARPRCFTTCWWTATATTSRCTPRCRSTRARSGSPTCGSGRETAAATTGPGPLHAALPPVSPSLSPRPLPLIIWA